MRKLALALALLASTATPALAAEGPLLIRLRGVYVVPADKSDAFATVAKDEVTVSKKLIPEVDFSYFIIPNLAAELILTYPQEHDVKVSGEKIGTVTHLPPCLTAQWHFLPGKLADPYLGAGVNLTLITDQNLVSDLKVSQSSFGFVGQAGVDVKVAEHWYVNADVKYVTMGFDVKAGGTKLTHLTLNPWLLGLGAGYRF